MMYDFCRNLCNIVAIFLFCAWLCLGDAHRANAATNAPHTGLDGGQRHGFGPDVQTKQGSGIPAGKVIVDAYGNPVLPEEEKVTPRNRLRRGAYGGGNEEPMRPLPDLPETDAGWQFK